LWPSRFWELPERRHSVSRWSGSKSQGNLEYRACGCQGISGAKQETDSIKTKKARRKPGENREENMNDRAAAWELLTLFTQSESLRKHALAVEACMRAYARKFSGDEELWGIVGLLHDFDYDKYPSLEDHPYKGNEILKERGWSEEIRKAIMSHAEYTGVTRDTPMEKALFACDELAGFITACALVKPGKSLAEVEAASVKKKMKDKAFARSVNRADITNGAADLGVELEPHIAFCIEAMRGIAGELGLDGSAAKTA
jgi:putative nucleotidyltransferase with HDIG domain